MDQPNESMSQLDPMPQQISIVINEFPHLKAQQNLALEKTLMDDKNEGHAGLTMIMSNHHPQTFLPSESQS
jgi:hypothetical protein